MKISALLISITRTLTLKHTLIFALALTLSLTLFSQPHKYIPFPDSAFIWRVWSYDSFNNNESNYQYFTNGDDTVIKGNEYFIVYHTIYADLPTNGLNKVYVRNDTLNKKVYVFPGSSTNKEGVLYDFNLKVGDTTKSPLFGGGGMQHYPDGLVVTKIDSLWLDDRWHHVWHFFENGTFDTVFPMIEGIGGRCGPFETPGVFEYAAWLDCAMKDGKAFFPNGIDTCELATSIKEAASPAPSFSIFPNPVSGELHISSDMAFMRDIKLRIYDLTGNEVLCPMIEKDAGEIIIDVSNVTNGLYFLLLESNTEHLYKGRFIKTGNR